MSSTCGTGLDRDGVVECQDQLSSGFDMEVKMAGMRQVKVFSQLVAMCRSRGAVRKALKS